MKRVLIPINTDGDECSVCIKSNYFKMGVANFVPQMGGENMRLPG